MIDAVSPEVPPGWTIHRNGNNAALMPPWLGKAHAVAALLPRLIGREREREGLGCGEEVGERARPDLRVAHRELGGLAAQPVAITEWSEAG